jgi:hypothetical protein
MSVHRLQSPAVWRKMPLFPQRGSRPSSVMMDLSPRTRLLRKWYRVAVLVASCAGRRGVAVTVLSKLDNWLVVQQPDRAQEARAHLRYLHLVLGSLEA